ncbi:hypothetical protein [Qipengyuania mesophila]|uniref:hypothetical protein n=1 Tax=Qipengyuania mesophila TaxID=2867246 RepID=UPI00351276B4
MNRLLITSLLPLAAVLGGCVSTGYYQAGNKLADLCESNGPDTRIASPTAESQGGMFGNVVVSGDCVSPGDEGYDEAMTIKEYRASIGKKPT